MANVYGILYGVNWGGGLVQWKRRQVALGRGMIFMIKRE